MPFADREETYLRLLAAGERTVEELSQKLFVSPPTVRRDLCRLRARDEVIWQGGHVRLRTRFPDQRIPLFIRDTEQNGAKAEIARRAATLVEDGFTVMLDASTTAAHLLPYLAERRNLILITNGLRTAAEALALGIRTVLIGGELTPESYSAVGTDAEQLLSHYNADVALFSCRGLSEDGAVTDNSVLENAVRRLMCKNARRTYLLCDKSKFGKICLHTLCHKQDLTGIISDM